MSRLQLHNVHSKHLTGMSHVFGAGPHWVLSSDSSSADDLVGLCAGTVRAKRGQVSLDDAPVSRASYREVGVLPATVVFPHLSVERLMNVALHRKGATQTAQQLLADWDLASLGPQLASTLDNTAARRIALLLALATPKPKLLALHDVFSLGLPHKPLLASLTGGTAQGAVVLLTADRSEVDGLEMATSALPESSLWVLQPSRLVAPDQLPKTHDSRTDNRLFIVCGDARALSEQLSRDSRIRSLRLEERSSPPLIEVTGESADALAGAVADAALQRNVDIRYMASSLSPIVEVARIQPRPPISEAQIS